MFRKCHFFSFILLFSFIFCLTNTFADENVDPIDIEDIIDIIAEGNFEFPIPDGAAYIQGTPEFQKVLESIIGTNDFEKMRDLATDSQDYKLGRKVGMIITRTQSGGIKFCTGFLVGPDLFMTNHHCIDGVGSLPLGRAIAIFMDYYQDDRTLGGLTARASAIVRADATKDYALLRLDKSIGNTYGWLALDTTITAPDTSQSVKLMSHPGRRSKEIVRRNSQIVAIPAGHPWENVPFALLYLADTQGGSSGSPVFLRGGTSVIGIHHTR